MDGLGVLNWVVVNDTVMGGRSEARLKWVTARGLVWSGNLSLENNGGFVSIRTRDAWFDWSQYDGVEVELEGSGRDVQVTLQRKDLRMRGGGYWAMLPTSEAGRTRAFIPFSAFDLKRFGRSVNGPALREGLGAIGEVGLLIADKKPGAFEVVLHKVTPVRLGPDHRTSPEVASAIIGAIERGAPIFNRGDTQGCAKLYRETLEGLLEGPSLGQA